MPVSRILSPTSWGVIIYLEQYSRIVSSCQPTYIGRAVLRRMPIWHFSTQGLPPLHVAMPRRSLLHYIFTLTTVAGGGYFLWHCLYLAGGQTLPVR